MRAGLAVVLGLQLCACAHTNSEFECHARIARAVAEATARQAPAVLLFDDRAGSERMVADAVQTAPGGVYAALHKDDGSLVAVSNARGLKAPELARLRAGTLEADGLVWVAAPIQAPPGLEPEIKLPAGMGDTGALLPADDSGPTRAPGALIEGPATRPGQDPAAVLDSDPKQPGVAPAARAGAPLGWLVIAVQPVG